MAKALIRKSIGLVPWRLRAVIKHIPVLAPLQRWIVGGFLSGREFEHTVDAGPAKGVTFPVKLPDDKGIWTGTYEQEFTERLATLVNAGDVCCDIGGWHGFFGAVMAARGAAEVYIFEPMPENCGRISRMISLNENFPIHLVEGAVGSGDGEATFEILPESSMGKLSGSVFESGNAAKERIKVKVVALDSFFAGREAAPAMMKIDVEGAELQVLEGATRIIGAARPRLLIEVHSRELANSVSGFLKERDYGIEVLETGRAPDGSSEPEVCHFVGMPR